MRLSDAIALGRTLIKSVPYYRNDTNGGGCALGMADVAIGSTDSLNHYPWTCAEGSKFDLPCGCEKVILNHQWASRIIVHIFNEHVHGDGDWTLDRLIDWVRSVEPIEPNEQQAEQVEEVEYATVT